LLIVHLALTTGWRDVAVALAGNLLAIVFYALVTLFGLALLLASAPSVRLLIYVLGGACIVRAVAFRRGVVLHLGRSMLLQTLVGIAGFAVGATVASATVDTDAVAFGIDLVTTLVVAVPLVRWLARPMAVLAGPDAAW